ncbi:MAG: NAD(P)-dependent oxidoreductase [Spirochaetia bacterium]|nr:NAD(P)-dependent oxidoreductase [Spirochaetia bacterium]
MPTIAIIGTGIMGRGIALNLKKAGHSMRIFARNKAKIADMLDANTVHFETAAEAVRGADLTVLCLTEDEVIRRTVLTPELLSGIRGIIIDVGTTSPDLTIEMHHLFKQHSARFFDSPMTGSKTAANEGQIFFIVGGSEQDISDTKYFYDACSRGFVRCGGVGDAQRAKIVLNMVQAGTLQMFIEGLSLATKIGIEAQTMKSIIENSAARSGLSDFKAPFILAKNFETHFSVRNMNKDLNHAMHLALGTNAELPLSFSLKGVFDRAMNSGHAESDFCAIAANVEIR